MDPQPGRLALVEQPEPLIHRRALPPGAGGRDRVVPAGPSAVGARRDPEHLRPHRALLHRPRRPRRRPRPRHPVLKVNCWGRTWGPHGDARVARASSSSRASVVSLRGRVEFYKPKGQINFIATDVDVTALLGRLAARRAALLQHPRDRRAARRNQALAVPDVPLRIGLVASPGSEGYNDFVGQLHDSDSPSPWCCSSQCTGSRGAGSISGTARPRRRRTADSASWCGRRIARVIWPPSTPSPSPVPSRPCRFPLWTGIGHTGDRSVADIVANHAFVTPTACGAGAGSPGAEFWESVAELRHARSDAAPKTRWRLRRTRRGGPRRRLGTATRNQLSRHTERLEHRVAQITDQRAPAARLRRRLRAAPDSSDRPRAVGVLDRHQDRAETWRRLLAAYDIERQLERGYTITLRPDGRLVRSVAELDAGSTLITRFADGRASSIVDGTESRSTTEGQQ